MIPSCAAPPPRRSSELAREAGARKVYFASAAPPVRYPYVYGIDMPAAFELVAAGREVDEIARQIGADWLLYQDLEDLVSACRHDNAAITEFDTSCFSGTYVTGDVHAGIPRAAGARAFRWRQGAASRQRAESRQLIRSGRVGSFHPCGCC